MLQSSITRDVDMKPDSLTSSTVPITTSVCPLNRNEQQQEEEGKKLDQNLNLKLKQKTKKLIWHRTI